MLWKVLIGKVFTSYSDSMELLQDHHDGIFVAACKAKDVALHKNAVFRTEPNRQLVRVNVKTLYKSCFFEYVLTFRDFRKCIDRNPCF